MRSRVRFTGRGVALAVMLAATPAWAQRVSEPSLFAGITGSGARALGMAGAFTAIADDATAASWNPAGLCVLERPEASLVGQPYTGLTSSYPSYTYRGNSVTRTATSTSTIVEQETGIPYETAIIRNHFVGRTFIEPAQSIRNFGVKIKHNPIRGVLEGKRVVLVDDSIVRGTSMLKISNMMRTAGAREVHVRISAPPTIRPCHYGIDMPTSEELIAANHSVDEIRRAIGADTLGYLSLESLRRASLQLKHGHCDACFSDDYPVPVNEEGGLPQLSLFRSLEDDPDHGGDA